jgi:hypothetical protein
VRTGVRSMSSRVAAQPFWRNGSMLKPQPWREQVQVLALDPFHGHATALRTSPPGATRQALDAFHVTQLDYAAANVPRCVQQHTPWGTAGVATTPCSRSGGVLRFGADNLTPPPGSARGPVLRAGTPKTSKSGGPGSPTRTCA